MPLQPHQLEQHIINCWTRAYCASIPFYLESHQTEYDVSVSCAAHADYAVKQLKQTFKINTDGKQQLTLSGNKVTIDIKQNPVDNGNAERDI